MRRIPICILVLALVLESTLAQQLPRLRRQEGPGPQSLSFGSSVVNLGDVDLDGVDDYAVSSPKESLAPGSMARGVVRVYSGATGAVIHTLNGIFDHDKFGTAIGGGGDVDADGVPDLVVGLPTGNNTAITGHVRVYSGASGNLIWAKVLGFVDGYRVAIVRDLDGDPFDDVVTSTGSFAVPIPGGTGAHVTVLSGLNANVVYMIPATAVGGNGGDSFGISLAGGEDFDQDGYGDFLVGWSSMGGLGAQTGGVCVISGLGGTLHQIFGGAPVFAFLGHSVALMGDLDGDGMKDVVAGGGGNGVVSVPGVVRVYSGQSGAAIHTLTGPILNDGFGYSVAGGADLDGDGVPDFATSTPDTNPTGPVVPVAFARGAVRAYSGATGQQIGLVQGLAPGSNIGTSLAMLRDSNHDGFGEVLVGSPRDDSGSFTDLGSVELLEFVGYSQYGSGNGFLQLTFVNGPPGLLSAGALTASGAGPLNPGVIAADVTYGNTTVGTPPIPVWVGQTAALLLHPVTYDAAGAWSLGFNLRFPPLAGVVVFTQAFELSPAGIVASSGLQLIFGP